MEPTAKQLAFLRALAQRTGETFSYPRTRAQASSETRRLQQRKPSTRLERFLDRRDVARDLQAGSGDAVRFGDVEVQCALEIADAGNAGLPIRAGLHTGEVERISDLLGEYSEKLKSVLAEFDHQEPVLTPLMEWLRERVAHTAEAATLPPQVLSELPVELRNSDLALQQGPQAGMNACHQRQDGSDGSHGALLPTGAGKHGLEPVPWARPRPLTTSIAALQARDQVTMAHGGFTAHS